MKDVSQIHKHTHTRTSTYIKIIIVIIIIIIFRMFGMFPIWSPAQYGCQLLPSGINLGYVL